MAVLDIEGDDTAVVSAVRRQRRVGALFVFAVAAVATYGRDDGGIAFQLKHGHGGSSDRARRRACRR